MIGEPQVALAASVRDWAQRLHRHVADHGGLRVRATVLHPADALDQDHDVFVGDDCTSFLSPRFVQEMHRRGRTVVGVFDPDDPTGKDELVECGVDSVIAQDASAQEFVSAICEAMPTARMLRDAAAREQDDHGAPGGASRLVDGAIGDGRGVGGGEEQAARGYGPVTAVGGAGGGVGATELAVAITASAARRGYPTALVDADETAPSLAQRLGTETYPNLRAAVDTLDRDPSQLGSILHQVADGVGVLPGLSSPRNWVEHRPADARDVVRGLAHVRDRVVVNVGSCVEDLHAAGGPSRYGLSRRIMADADAHVVVASPTPAGLTRLLEWLADLRVLRPDALAHVVFNRMVGDEYRRGELVDELARTVVPAGVWFVPHDPRVIESSWTGDLVPDGPFTRAAALLTEQVLDLAPRRRRALRGWRR